MPTTTSASLHETPTDHLAKLRRLRDRMLTKEMHRDDFDDFCKTAWHLIELVERSSSADRLTKRKATALRSEHAFAVCEYLGNMGKHGRTRPTAVQRAKFSVIEISVGFGQGRFGMGGFGVGEQSIVVRFVDGTEANALDLVEEVMAKWEAILR